MSDKRRSKFYQRMLMAEEFHSCNTGSPELPRWTPTSETKSTSKQKTGGNKNQWDKRRSKFYQRMLMAEEFHNFNTGSPDLPRWTRTSETKSTSEQRSGDEKNQPEK